MSKYVLTITIVFLKIVFSRLSYHSCPAILKATICDLMEFCLQFLTEQSITYSSLVSAKIVCRNSVSKILCMYICEEVVQKNFYKRFARK